MTAAATLVATTAATAAATTVASAGFERVGKFVNLFLCCGTRLYDTTDKLPP
ncbi:MAG: hypothetical protein II296_04775 [Bacteroidaceae bacterium]|nr:hypothetical protein [Bacteroidaceae bacterium]